MFIQLNKFIAHAGICSRRKAEELIKSGAITVNGSIETNSAYRVKDTDTVRYNGQKLKQERKIYILLNKPKGYITTTSDERNRKTILDLLEKYSEYRLYPVGRLDRATTGVLLVTNDGQLAQDLIHPRNKISKTYTVTLDKKVLKEDIEKLLEGVKLSDGFIKLDDACITENPKKIVVNIHSGRNHIIRRIFKYFDYDVVTLDRICFAGITKSKLMRGQSRPLTQEEIKDLDKLIPKSKKKKKTFKGK